MNNQKEMVAKTKAAAKKFVRYQEGADKYSIGITKFKALAREAHAVYNLSISTLDTINGVLRPTFQLAVRDSIIRNNPTEGVMKEVSKQSDKAKGVRHALTIEQQRAFMNYIANHPVYYHWWPMFTILLGTGCRIGEAVGLRWDDIDMDKRLISVNHSLVYYPIGESRTSVLHISKPKTEAGIRMSASKKLKRR